MKSEDRDLPTASDYKKSTENQGVQIPDILTSGTGVLIGFAIVIVIGAIAWIASNVSFSKPIKNPLESHAAYASLKTHVENLGDVDVICAQKDRAGCLCQLAERVRDEHNAVDQIIASDPGLKDFSIQVIKAGTPTRSYTLASLPKAPADSDCLNVVAAPTIIDDGTGPTDAPTGADSSAPTGQPAGGASNGATDAAGAGTAPATAPSPTRQ